MADATELLERINAGDQKAGDQLFPLVYDQLRALAAKHLRGESSAHTLQPTALVHEAYLRLIRPERNSQNGNGRSSSQPQDPATRYLNAPLADQSHFFAAASQAMRRILVDHARHKKRLKRGAAWSRVPIDLNQLPAETDRLDTPDYLLSLDEALTKLAGVDPTAAELVHLRYFAGLSVQQAATALGISERTAHRTWNFAKAWLYDRISGKEP